MHGHTRILRGATVLNPCHDPSTDNTIDISYSLNDISDVALDVYGRVRVFEGPTYNGLVKSAPEIDLSGSSVNAAKISMYNDGSLTLNLNANDGIISGNSSGDGIKIRDVSNIRFLDNTEIFAGNSLDISSDKVEFLHGDVHVVENLSVSGNVISAGSLNAFTAAAIDTLNVETKLACNGDASFNDNVTIGNNLQIDGALQVGSTGTGSILGTIQTQNQPNITSVGTLTSVDINGGAIDGTVIGANSAADGTFDTITANNASISTITNAALTNPTINGGTIDGPTIGATTPNTGAFTTLSATSLSAPAPATLGITGNLTGNVTGNLTGDVTGNLTGDVTGDVTGNLTGDVTGDVTGNLTGDVTGDVTGDLTGDVTGNVTGNLTGDVTGDVTGNVTGDVTGNVTGNLTGDVTGDVTGNVTGDVTGNVTGNVTGDVTGTLQTAAQPNITTVNKDLVLGASTSSVNEVASITLGGTNTRRFSVDSDPVTGEAVFGTSSRQLPINLKGGNGATDVVLKNSNGTGTLLMETSGPASGLRVPKFGLGVTPAGRQSAANVTTNGYLKNASTASTTVHAESTFTGNMSGDAYTINDIVKALKTLGILQ